MKLTRNEWLRAGRGMVLSLVVMGLMGTMLGVLANAQAVSTTTVQGTVYLANGQAGTGTLVVSWPAFTTANGQAVAADSTTVAIAPDGFVSVNLAPNLGATPAGLYYTAVYYLSDGTTNTQYWVVPAAAQASLAQVQAQLMPAAQAVQTVSKAYVDQAIAEMLQSELTESGGTMTGPLYLSGDPTQPLQAADKHYVDESLALAVPLAGGSMTGPLAAPAVNGVESPVAGSAQTTLQAAMNAAGSSGAMEIPPTYAGSDGFTNPNGVHVTDLRPSGAQQQERSVKEFGAVCDGVTDDTNALQAALSYAQTHGVALTIPQGTCKTRALSWHGESIGGMGKQVSALMGFPGQDVLVSGTDSMNLLSYTRIHDLTIYVDQSVDVSCTPAEGRAPAGSCAVGRQMESHSIFSPGGNGLTGTLGTGTAWAVGNCAIAMPAVTGAGGNGLRVAEIENVEIAATGVDPMAAEYPGAHSTHTCGLYLGQWPQWSEFRNIDIRGLNTGIAIPALPGTTPAGLNADSNRWQNITIQATHGFTAAAGSNNVLDNVVATAGNSAATAEPPTGVVLDFAGAQQGWTVRNAVVLPQWDAVQPQLTVTAAGGAVTGVTAGPEQGLGFDPYGTEIPVTFSGACTAAATANVNSNGSIGTISVTQGGVGCSGTTTASLNVAGAWDTAAPVNLISGQSMALFGGNLLKGKGGYTVWNATGSQSYGTQLDGGGGTLPGGGSYAALVENSPLGASSQVDQFPGADLGAKIQACLNTLSASYGGTCDARNFTGTQSMGSNLTIATANATVLLPCATISTASQVIVTAGTRNVSLRGCALRGASTASGSKGGTVFLYSGTNAMVQVGDPTYAADTNGFHMDNAAINTTGSTSATAQGLAAYRTQEMDLEDLYFLGNSNQTGMTLDGTGNYTGGSFLSNQFTGFQTAVNAIGHQISNPATTDWMNASTFVRLHIDCPTSGGNQIAGTYGINLQQGDGNTFTGGDVEGCSTALHLGPNAQNNTIVGLRNENSANQVVADAGSAYNNWMTGGTMFTGQLTDNGTRNSFLDTFHRSFNGMNGDWYGSQKDATVINHYRIGIGAGNERGLQDRYQTDYGYRWTTGLSDATAGEQFYQILDELNDVYRLSIGQYNYGQPSTNNQTVINAAGTGAIVLNGSNNSGTGGVVFGSGGPSETTVATINDAGNAQFNGTLQVSGNSTFISTPTVKNQADAEIDATLWAGLTTSQKESFIYKDWNGNSQWYMVKDASNNWALNSATGGLDSFKAYQSTNSGDTYIDASNPSGAVRVNYEPGSGTGFDIYGGGSTLYASFTGTNAIKFPGLAASSGLSCLQIDNSGFISNTGAGCGSGPGGNGTVSSGSAGQIAYYTASGTTIGGTNTVPLTAGGTGAATAAGALANLGGAALAGTAFTGPISATQVTSAASPVNVKNPAYGAAGNGIADDTAALQAAINAASLTGDEVDLPQGTYLINTTLMIQAPSPGSQLGPIHLKCIGARGWHGLSANPANNGGCVLSKMTTFSSSVTNSPAIEILGPTMASGISEIGSTTIDGITISAQTPGQAGDGIEVLDHGALLRDVFVRIQGGNGIRIGDDAGAYDCNNWNLITSSAWYNTGAGLYVSSGTTTDANAGTMIGFSTRYNTGDGIAFGYAEDNTSHGGESEGNGGIGFHFMTNSNNITVEGMDSEGNTGGNLQFEAGTSFNTYDGTTSGTRAYVDKATVVSQTGTSNRVLRGSSVIREMGRLNGGAPPICFGCGPNAGNQTGAEFEVPNVSTSTENIAATNFESGQQPIIAVRSANGNGFTTGPQNVGNGTALGRFSIDGYSTTWQPGAYIDGIIDGTPGASSMPTDLRFFTAGASGAPVENMRLNSTGELGVGKTAASGHTLDVNGPIYGTQLNSSVSTGTAPLTVASTTPVANLSIGGNAATATTATTATTAGALSTTGGNGAFWGISGGTQGWYTPSGSGTVTTSGSPSSGNIAAFSSSTAITAATAAQIVSSIGTTPVTNATTATNFSGSLAGDVTGTQGSTSVVQVNGAAIPASKTIVGTNSSNQIVDASTATLANNTTGNAGTASALSTTGGNGTYWGISGGVQGWYTPSGSGTVNSGSAYSPAYYPASGTAISGVTPFTGLAYWSTSAAPAAATSAQIQGAIGSSVYDAYGAATTAQSNAETYASNASNLSSGTVALARLPSLSANQVLGALTATPPSGLTMPSCYAAGSALEWESGTGFACNTSLATSGANSSITSLSGLTTPLSPAQGGTGGDGTGYAYGSGTSAFTYSTTIPFSAISGTINATNVNGASVPASKTMVGTNSSGQIIDASSATLANNTTGNAATATYLAGGAAGSLPYQSGAATTGFIASPTTSGHTFVPAWQPSGSAIAPAALDLATYLASPPAIGGTTPAAGSFSGATLTGSMSMNQGSSSSEQVIYGDRVGIGQPVPYVEPTATSTPVAFDLAPTPGAANQNSNTGVAWIDVCDAAFANPCVATGNTNYESLRLGILANGMVHVGSAYGGTGTYHPLVLEGMGGNVGIGTGFTTAPAYLLQMHGTSNPGININLDSGDNEYLNFSTGAGAFFTNSIVDDFNIRGTGGNINLGSNSSTPAYTMQITPGSPGNVVVAGNLQNSNGTVIPSTATGYQGPATGNVQLAPAPSGAGYLYQNGSGTYSWGSPLTSLYATPASDVICAHAADTTIAAVTITGIAYSSPTFTFTTSGGHMIAYGYTAGQTVQVQGTSGGTGNFNAQYTITAVTGSNGFTATSGTATGTSYGSGGTVSMVCNNTSTDAVTNFMAFASSLTLPGMSTFNQFDIRGQYALYTPAGAPTLYGPDIFYGATPSQVTAYSGPTSLGTSENGILGSSGFTFTVPASGVIYGTPDFQSVGYSTTGPYGIASVTNTATSSTAPLYLELKFSSTGVASITSGSGGSISGVGTCTLSSFNDSATNAAATVTFATSGSWTGATFAITNTGYGATAAPTSATLASGTATCSGTATLVTTLGGAQGAALRLLSYVAKQQ